jgi:hypothetical protein
MFDRQNPYFQAAMRNERLEAECREFASWMEKRAEQESARAAISSDSPQSSVSSEGHQQLGRRIWLALAMQLREEADRHARMREKMEPFL